MFICLDITVKDPDPARRARRPPKERGRPARNGPPRRSTMPRTQERYELELHCARCRRTTTHSVAIGDRSLSRVMCIACGRAVAVDTLQFMEQYVDSVMRRILAKPFEITTEFKRSPRALMTLLQRRVRRRAFGECAR